MKKKILSLCLVVAMVATAIAGASMAYLTDTESEVNVMTVGKVNVSLIEKQRDEDGDELVDFVQGKELTPLVGNAQGEKDKFGQPVAENYVDKIVYAHNDGNKPAYIRFLVAVPVALIPNKDDDQAPLHWNWGNRVDITGKDSSDNNQDTHKAWMAAIDYADENGNYDVAGSVTIDDVEYWVSAFYMKTALGANTTSPVIMSGLYLDNRVDYNDETGKYTFNGTEINYDLSKGVNIPVLLQAVQTDGWEADGNKAAYKVAFDTAFGDFTVENAEAWFAGVKTLVVVDNAEELATALEAGEDVMLNEDVALTSAVDVNGGTLNGNGNTIDASNADTGSWGKYAVTMNNGGTVENVTVENAFYGVGSTNTTEDIYIDNVTIDKVTYAINGNGNGEASVYVTNSTVYGWISYADVASLNFTNCTLGMGNSYDGYLVVYGTTNFTNCKFVGTFDMGAREENGVVCAAGKTITFTNCTYDDVKVTADNFVNYFYYGEDDAEDFGNLMRECTIIVDGVKVDNSAYIN